MTTIHSGPVQPRGPSSALITAESSRSGAHRTPTEPTAAPVGASAQLHMVAAVAGQLTDLLDQLRAGCLSQGLSGPDPMFVALDQAAAAAHDLGINTHCALSILSARASQPTAQGWL